MINSVDNGRLFMNTKRYPFYAFVFTLITYTSVLSGVGVLGNGLLLLETGDWMTQHIPFIMEMGEVIKGNHSLWYSWNMGIGSGSIGNYAYYAFSPFNIFYWVLGEKGKHIASACIIILKASASAATFQIFITKLLRRSYYETILFSMLYALNGFVVCDFHSILSLDSVFIFPIIITGIIKLFRDNEFITLIFAYSYLFLSSLYMGYIAGVCSFIMFIFYYLYKRKDMGKKKKQHILAGYMISVLIALGFTAIIWVPCVCNMIELRNADEIYENVVNCNPIMLLNNSFAGMYQSLDGFIPYYYCGLLTVMAVPLFAVNKHISIRKRKYFILCLFSFILIMLIPPLNIAMHAFDRPNGMGYRYAFVLSFILVTILAEEFVFMVGRKGLNAKYICLLTLFSVAILVINKYAIIKKLGETSDSNLWYVIALNVVIPLALFLTINNYKAKRFDKLTRKALFTSIIVLEIVFNIAIIQKRIGSRGSVIIDEQFAVAEENTVSRIREDSKDEVFIRTIYQDTHISNLALEKDLSSLFFFSSLINKRLVNTLRSLGFEYNSNTISGNGWTPVTISLLGINYIIDGKYLLSDDPNIPVMTGANEHYYQNFIKNEKVLPLVFVVDRGILNYKSCESVFENQSSILSLMTGQKSEFYIPVDIVIDLKSSEGVDVDYESDSVIITNKNYPNADAFVEYHTTNAVNNDVYANLLNNQQAYKDSVYWSGPTISADYDINVYHTVHPRIYPNQIFKCGNIDPTYDGFKMIIPHTIQTVKYRKGYYVEYDEDEYDKIYRELNSNGMEITEFRDGYVAGNIECNTDCVLFSSIPYEKGWNAYVDGNKTDVLDIVEGAFVGVELTEGQHEVVLQYVAPGMYAGRYVTIATLVILFLLTSFDIWRRKRGCLD